MEPTPASTVHAMSAERHSRRAGVGFVVLAATVLVGPLAPRVAASAGSVGEPAVPGDLLPALIGLLVVAGGLAFYLNGRRRSPSPPRPLVEAPDPERMLEEALRASAPLRSLPLVDESRPAWVKRLNPDADPPPAPAPVGDAAEPPAAGV